MTRTYRSGGNGRNVIYDPALEDTAHDFEEMLTDMPGLQGGRNRGFPNDPMMASLFPFGSPQRQPFFGGFTAAGSIGSSDQHPQPFRNFNE